MSHRQVNSTRNVMHEKRGETWLTTFSMLDIRKKKCSFFSFIKEMDSCQPANKLLCETNRDKPAGKDGKNQLIGSHHSPYNTGESATLRKRHVHHQRCWHYASFTPAAYAEKRECL